MVFPNLVLEIGATEVYTDYGFVVRDKWGIGAEIIISSTKEYIPYKSRDSIRYADSLESGNIMTRLPATNSHEEEIDVRIIKEVIIVGLGCRIIFDKPLKHRHVVKKKKKNLFFHICLKRPEYVFDESIL